MLRRRHRPTARGFAVFVLATLIVLTTLTINAPEIAAHWYAWRFGLSADRLPDAARYGGDDRLLVVSPHPDDEVLCCAGMILQAIEAGAEVWIVHLTSGDGFELDALAIEFHLRPRGEALLALGRRRMAEARAAAAVLGIPAERVLFLGFPDRGMLEILRQDSTTPYVSPYTGRRHVPYADAWAPGLPYTGGALTAALHEVFAMVDPTIVLAPTPFDAHPDHRAAGELTLKLLFERRQVEAGRWWIVHGDLQWPLPKGVHRRSPLFPPLRASLLPWERFDLERDQVRTKHDAIRAYASQMLLLRRYLESFVKRNELVSRWPLPGPWVLGDEGR